MKVKIILPIIVGLFLILSPVFFISKLSVEMLIICSVENESYIMPNKVCKYYMFNFMDEATATDLDEGAGLAYIFQIEDEKTKLQFIEFFISIGVSVDRVSPIDGLSPLNASILLDDYEIVVLLVNNGALIDKKIEGQRYNALEYLKFLQEKDINRDKISNYLSSQ